MIKMARKKRLGRGTLAFGGAIFVGIAIMFVFFPSIVSTILPPDIDSGTWTFAFPDIDTVIIPQATVLTPTGFDDIPQSVVECDFKFTVQAFNSIGQIVEQRQSALSDPRTLFTTFFIQTFDISTRITSGTVSTSPFTEFSIAGILIDHYDIIPLFKCTKKTGDLTFESGVIVKNSPITLDTYISKPDGTTIRLSQKQLGVQTIGSDNTSFFFDFFGSKSGIMNNGVEIKFKGLGGTLSPDQKFRIDGSEIDRLLPAQLDKYNSEVRFQMRGTLNIDYVFNTANTQIFALDGTNLQKTLYISVDKRSEVTPTDPQIPQTIDIVSATTTSGKTIVTLSGTGQAQVNPDIAGDRELRVIAFLDEFAGGIESLPKLSLRHLSGSIVSGSNTVTMFEIGGDQFRNADILRIPSNILDGNYKLQVSNTRTNIGTATITVKTPDPTVIQPETCEAPLVSDGMGGCKKESTTQTCSQGFKLINGVCVEQFCADGTSATNGCIITVMVGSECGGNEIDNGDGTCTQPNCGVGLEWNTSSLRCEAIICDPVGGVNYEYDTILLTCQPSKLECTGSDVPNADKTACIPITEVTTIGGEIETNVLNIRQELRYFLVTTDQSGKRTPVESGVIPPDESLFVKLTELQFLVATKTNPLGVKFDVLEVDSFLVFPQIGSPQVSNVNLNQKLHIYHKNTITSTGVPSNNIPALTVTLPAGTLAKIATETGGGFYALGKLQITTSDILSAISPLEFFVDDKRTTTAGVELNEGDIISVMYVIDGEFDLSTDAGTRQFDGVIKQMRYWKNLIYTDKVLNGDECIGTSGRALLQCQFDVTGNNTLEGVCPPDPDKTEKQNFDECLASLTDRTIDLIINKACEDTSGFEALIEILNVESGFTEEFGGTGVKSTEDILRDLQLASGCDPMVAEMMEKVDEGFKCASGTFSKEGVTPTSQEQCFDQCSEELTMIVGGGEIHIKDDGSVECRAPPVVNGGIPMCQSGSTRDPTTGECVFPPAQPPSEQTQFINNLLESFSKFLESFTNSNEKEITGGGGSGGNVQQGGACSGNILNCIIELFGDDEPPEIIPPELQIGGSSTNTIILFVVIIIAILVIAVIVRRRRGV